MSSKIKVDTIENVAGSGNVSLGSGHNLVVPGNITGSGTATITGDLTVDTNTLIADASADKVFVNRTTQTKNTDAFVVSSPSGGVGGGNARVDMTVTAEDLTGDGGANANAFVTTKAKGVYYSGLEISSTAGHVGGFIGNYGASAATRKLELRVGGTGINASDAEAMKVNVGGQINMANQPIANAYYNANNQDGAYAATNRNNIICKPGATHVNVGNMYNSSTGRFTVPVAGRYLAMVSGSQYSQNVSSYWICNIQKNGSTQRSVYQTKDVTWEQLTGYTVLDCAANDYITFFNTNDSNSAADRGGWDVTVYTNFMVYLLS